VPGGLLRTRGANPEREAHCQEIGKKGGWVACEKKKPRKKNAKMNGFGRIEGYSFYIAGGGNGAGETSLKRGGRERKND